MFSSDDLQMLTRIFVYGLASATPWLLGAAAVIIGLTRGEARRALLSFIRAVRQRTAPPAVRPDEVAALLDHVRSLEERLSYAERALLTQRVASQEKLPTPGRIVVPPHLLRTPV